MSSPGAPASDADALQNVDAELTDVHEEEEEKPERTVTPVGTEEGKRINYSAYVV